MIKKERTAQIGARIRRRRIALDIQQQELAKQLGVTSATVSQWERGETRPKGDHTIAMAKVLGVTPSWIITGDDAEYGVHTHMQAVPVVYIGDFERALGNEDGYRPIGIRMTLADVGPTGVAVINPDAAMTASESPKSCSMGCHLLSCPERKWKPQDHVIARTKSNGIVHRRIISDGDRRILTSLNSIYGPIVMESGDKVLAVVVRAEVDLV